MPKIFSQLSNPQADNTELVFQAQGTEPYDEQVVFSISHVNGADIFCTKELCNYSKIIESFITDTIIIVGNYYDNTDHGLRTDAQCSNNLSSNSIKIEIRLSLYRIYVKYPNGNYTLYYDNRDCNYLLGSGNCIGCPRSGDNDITLRFNADNGKLYLYDGHATGFESNIQSNSNWDEVSNNSIIRWWDVKDCNTSSYRCPLDIPSLVENVEVSGNNGQHPTISWDFCSDADIINYNIYRSVDGAMYHNIATVASNVNSYTDN